MQGDGRGYQCLVALTKIYESLALKCLMNLCYLSSCRPLLGTAGLVECLVGILQKTSGITLSFFNQSHCFSCLYVCALKYEIITIITNGIDMFKNCLEKRVCNIFFINKCMPKGSCFGGSKVAMIKHKSKTAILIILNIILSISYSKIWDFRCSMVARRRCTSFSSTERRICQSLTTALLCWFAPSCNGGEK